MSSSVISKSTQLQWSQKEIINRLELLKRCSKTTHWLQHDLKVIESSWIGRFFWSIAKHFNWMRKQFYGIDLEASRAALKRIRPVIESSTDQTVRRLFNKAVANFKKIAPRHAPQGLTDPVSRLKVMHAEEGRLYRFSIPKIDLTLDIQDDKVIAYSKLLIKRDSPSSELVLSGRGLILNEIRVNGERLPPDCYTVTKSHLYLEGLPQGEEATVEIWSEIDPYHNDSLEGLYDSEGVLCSHCEARGFDKITWSDVEPDNLSVITTTLIADKNKYPVLLSNGDVTERIDLPEGRHLVTFYDHFPKPSYLWGCIAGDLACIEETFIYQNGREVQLRFFVGKGKEAWTEFAMHKAKQVLEYVHREYGLEYELPFLNFVAIKRFNKCLSECTGVLLFEESHLLGKADTTVDADFDKITLNVAKGIFHHWSGNHVMIKDWGQLSLKEGVGMYFAQKFMGSVSDPISRRIDHVEILQARQFAEDASPLAHPVLPDTYVNIRNYYTDTVSRKMAEILRMLEIILGETVFTHGLMLYFRSHHFESVTSDALIHAMEEISGKDLSQFKRWFHQKGTPTVTVTSYYDALEDTLELKVSQSTKEKPLMIPLSLGLITLSGREYSEKLRIITKAEETLTFKGIMSKPVPSLFRHFSAPIKLKCSYPPHELQTLFKYDPDLVNSFAAGKQLAKAIIYTLMRGIRIGKLPSGWMLNNAFKTILDNKGLSEELKAKCLTLPSVIEIAEGEKQYRYALAAKARLELQRSLAESMENEWNKIAQLPLNGTRGRRELRKMALDYLFSFEDERNSKIVVWRYEENKNMTDQFHAMQLLCHLDNDDRKYVLNSFYQKWHRKNPVMLNYWFAAQAGSHRSSALSEIAQLERHPDFCIKNPNRALSLLGTLAFHNPTVFHAVSGVGYKYLADKIIELDSLNSELASLLSTAFKSYPKMPALNQKLMRMQLERIQATKKLSSNTTEIINNLLIL